MLSIHLLYLLEALPDGSINVLTLRMKIWSQGKAMELVKVIYGVSGDYLVSVVSSPSFYSLYPSSRYPQAGFSSTV